MKAFLATLVVLAATAAPALAAGSHDLDVAVDSTGIRSSYPERYAINKPVHVHVHASDDVALQGFSIVLSHDGAAPIPVALRKIDATEYAADVKLPSAGAYDVAMTAQVSGVKFPAPPVTIHGTSNALAVMPVRTVALATVPFVGALAGLFFLRRSRREQPSETA
jgi:hypothetical protein